MSSRSVSLVSVALIAVLVINTIPASAGASVVSHASTMVSSAIHSARSMSLPDLSGWWANLWPEDEKDSSIPMTMDPGVNAMTAPDLSAWRASTSP